MAKMTTGMRMLAMTKAAGNGRENNGGRMEGSNYRMEGNSGGQARYYPGGIPPYVEGNEMRGRNGMRMREENPLNGVDTQHQPYTHSEPEHSHGGREEGRGDGQSARMAGEGYVMWDRMENGGREDMRPYPPVYPRGEMAEGNITSMHDYERKKGAHGEHHRMIGYQQNDDDEHEHLDRSKAEEWVEKMKNIQIRMPYEEVHRRAVNYGVPAEKIPEFYAVFNMMQSDYGTVAKEFGISKVDFYAAMAKAWLDDEDAVENKTALYEKCIVKKDSHGTATGK